MYDLKVMKSSIMITVNVLKFGSLFSYCPQIKCGLTGLELIKCMSE